MANVLFKTVSRKLFIESHGTCSFTFLAVIGVSQSRFLYKAFSEGLEVPIRLFVFINDVFASTDIEF